MGIKNKIHYMYIVHIKAVIEKNENIYVYTYIYCILLRLFNDNKYKTLNFYLRKNKTKYF